MRPFDASGAFAPPVPPGGQALRRLAMRGAGMTVFSGAIGLSIQIVATVVLGRLLSPRDFGLVTMVTTFSLLLVNATTNGFTDAVVQRKSIDRTLASTLFWINMGLGVVLSLAFAAAGPLIARFFTEKPVAAICAGMSATIFFSSASVMHLALLKRAMRFSSVAKNDIIARAVGVLTSITFGLAHWGYWALVMGACALTLSTSIGAWILCPWLPGRPGPLRQTGSTVNFATHITGRFSLNYFARNSDNLLVGWRFGAHALGFYKKAYDLFALSASQLVAATSTVAVAALSRVRDDRSQYMRYLLGSISVMALIGMGLAGDLTLVGKDLIRLLLGPGWGPAGQIFTYFAPGIGIMIIYTIHGWIHVSIGRADRWFAWGLIEWTVTFSLFLLCLRWGPEGIAVAWCVSFWLLTLPALWFAGKPVGLGVMPVIDATWRYIAAALAAFIACHALVARYALFAQVQRGPGAALRIAATSAIFLLLYCGGIIVLHGGIAPLRRIFNLLAELTSRRGGPVAVAAVPVDTTTV